MVDGSNVQKSLTRHQRQRDQETVTAQEQKNQLDQQRLSLLTAEKFVEHFHTSSSLDESTKVVHQFYKARPKKTEESKKWASHLPSARESTTVYSSAKVSATLEYRPVYWDW